MTQSSRPFTGTTIGDAGPYSAAQWWEIYKYLPGASAPDAGPLVGSGAAPEIGLTVAETSPASAGVRVFEGRAVVDGTFYESDATETLSIAANVSGNPRIDTVILRRDDTLQTVRLAVLTGTPAATPVAPSLTQSATIWEIPLADIAVANGFATITNDNITPRRTFANASDGVYLLDILNNSGGILEAGDVVINDTSATRGATTTTTARDTRVIGVWAARTANGGYGRVLRYGVGYIRTSAAATRGDYLAVSATAKQADVIASGAANTVSQARLIGTALETTTGAGLCLCLINVWWTRRYAYQAIKHDNGANYTTTGGFANIDATNLSITLTVHTGKVLITFTGLASASANFADFDVSVDGTRVGSAGGNGLIRASVLATNFGTNVSFSVLVDGLSVGSHTFRMMFQSGGGSTATLYSGVTVNFDSIPTFSVREVE